MKKFPRPFALLLGLVISVSGLIGLSLPAAAINVHANERAVCPVSSPVAARCHAHVATDVRGNPLVTPAPSGYGPAQFHGGYGVGATAPGNVTIAVVDAYNDPYIKSDLDYYNSAYGLPYFPNCSSTVTTACFKKINQRGSTAYPGSSSGWALEMALDVE